MRRVLAREEEQDKIRRLLQSPKSELVAVYGRRRVGKTFTITETMKENQEALIFIFTGSMHEDGRHPSVNEFIRDFGLACLVTLGEVPSLRNIEDCLSVFVTLAKRASEDQPVYLFLDELPWIAKTSPDFFRSFVTLWNNALSKEPYLKLFVAGSATSWMIEHVIQAKMGLAKRITAKLHLKAFDLKQTRDFLRGNGYDVSSNDLMLLYSALGGIPYYLDALETHISPIENLYQLLVVDDGLLCARTEYEQLFQYLFSSHQSYLDVINVLVQRKYGLSQAKLSNELKGNEKSNGNLRRILSNLEHSQLIDRRINFLNVKRGIHFFVADEYIRFVVRWLLPNPGKSNVRTLPDLNEVLNSSAYHAWQGFNFELIAFKNYHLIQNALGLSGISATPYIYYRDESTQIDLLLDRGDQTITICEAKSSDGPYECTTQDVDKWRIRKQAIEALLSTKRLPARHINYCFITRNGIKANRFSREINPLIVDFSKLLD